MGNSELVKRERGWSLFVKMVGRIMGESLDKGVYTALCC